MGVPGRGDIDQCSVSMDAGRETAIVSLNCGGRREVSATARRHELAAYLEAACPQGAATSAPVEIAAPAADKRIDCLAIIID